MSSMKDTKLTFDNQIDYHVYYHNHIIWEYLVDQHFFDKKVSLGVRLRQYTGTIVASRSVFRLQVGNLADSLVILGGLPSPLSPALVWP